jgi:hypothetical protein
MTDVFFCRVFCSNICHLDIQVFHCSKEKRIELLVQASMFGQFTEARVNLKEQLRP